MKCYYLGAMGVSFLPNLVGEASEMIFMTALIKMFKFVWCLQLLRTMHIKCKLTNIYQNIANRRSNTQEI